MKKHRRQFSAQFKQEAIDLVRQTGKSPNQIAKVLGFNQTSLKPLDWGSSIESGR
jgi:transposase-like protein